LPYCPNCGKEVKEDAVYCPYCGASLKPSAATPPRYVYRHRRDEKNEKDEKGEKDEKNEKNEKGEKSEGGEGGMLAALTGGLVVIWLGISFLLGDYGIVSRSNWWALFLVGLGIILVIRGFMGYSHSGNWRHGSGFIIGGVVLFLIGIASFAGINEWWPLVVIALGLWIIVGTTMMRKRNPAPPLPPAAPTPT